MYGLIAAFAFALTLLMHLFWKQNKKNVMGKLALVTGGGNGLGQQICLELAALGCNVVIADIDFPSAHKTAESLKKFGVSAKAYKVEVSNYSEIMQLRDNISTDFGQVDILVNNAGLIPFKTIFEQTAEDVERLTKVNLNSVILMTKCFLEEMIERRSGHVVAIASLQGIYAFPYSLSYCATKFGVTGFMLGLIEMIRRKNLSKLIHVTYVAPHVINTRTDIVKALNSRLKLLRPEEVAKATVDAMLMNKQFLTVPFFFGFAISIFNVFPFWVQHFIRDYVNHESSFMKSSQAHS